jgi:hypothetical protein
MASFVAINQEQRGLDLAKRYTSDSRASSSNSSPAGGFSKALRGQTRENKAGDVMVPVVPGKDGQENDSSSAGDAVREAVKFTARQQFYLLVEDPDSSIFARLYSHFILYTIVASIACFVLETHPSLRGAHLFTLVEPTTTIIFTVEYVARFLVCDAFPPECYGYQSKCNFLRDPMNVLDLMAIAPFYLEVAAKELMQSAKSLRALRAVRLIRIFRIFKLSRYSLGMTIMVEAVVNSIPILGILCFFLLIGVILSSSLMYYAERTGCPDVKAMIAANTFHRYEQECYEIDTGWSSSGDLCCDKHGSALDFVSIQGAFWWSFVTMTTVGYGDHVPRTFAGRLVGCLAMISGIVLISLPVAIVGSRFQLAYESLEERPLRDDELDSGFGPRWSRESAGSAAVANTGADALNAEKEEPKTQRMPGMIQAASMANKEAEPHFSVLRRRLQTLERQPHLSEKAVEELYLLLEMFDHVERVEKQLKTLRDKDALLDMQIRKEFGVLSRAYDHSVREKYVH